MKSIIILFSSFLLILSCADNKEVKTSEKALTADAIIDKAIDVSCQGNCDNAAIEFTFRDKVYKSSRNNGAYKLERIVKDSIHETHDIVTNRGLYRYINKERFVVQDSIANNISDNVNSVHYFAQLPYGLNASAVQKKLIGETQLKGKDYYKIEVTFSEENGGTDFEDEFLYWIDKKSFTVDYLAYKYATNGGGVRFREAYNPRVIEGIRFVDYNNFMPENKKVKLSTLDKMFADGDLKLLSKIESENVSVKISD